MAFLSWLGQAVINWVLNALRELVGGIIARINLYKKIDKQAEDSVVPLKEAKTDEEIDKATDDALDHL